MSLNHLIRLTFNPSSQAVAVLDRSLTDALATLRVFAQQENFIEQLQLAFGRTFDSASASALQSLLEAGDRGWLPIVEVRSGADLPGANGAYDRTNDRILVSADFLERNADNPSAIVNLLLEEIGHKFDRVLNGTIDSPGDEGAIFAAIVQGQALSSEQLAQLQSEDDRRTFQIDGQSIVVELESWTGTSGDDTYTGTADGDYASGLEGDDTLNGGAGYNYLYGDAGNDTFTNGDDGGQLNGGDGNDVLNGGSGGEYLAGGNGTNELNGGDGDDSIYSTSITDTIDGGLGNDYLQINYSAETVGVDLDFSTGVTGIESVYIDGTQGDDQINVSSLPLTSSYYYSEAANIRGGEGNDTITGSSSYDRLHGDAGDDEVNGGDGDDYIAGGSGTNELNGGDGDDSIYSTSVTDTIDGGLGNDYLQINYSAETVGVNLDFSTGVTGIERVYIDGTQGDDQINVSNLPLTSGYYYSEAANIRGGEGNDTITGSSSYDRLHGDAGDDEVNGGGGDDYIAGGSGTNELNGGDGDDSIYSTSVTDEIDGGLGNDYLQINYSAATVGVDLDFSTGVTGIERVYIDGTQGDDEINVSSLPLTSSYYYSEAANIRGGEGDDIITGSSSYDRLHGDAGDDEVNGGGGDDYIAGGSGTNELNGGGGNDTIDSISTTDKIDGGDGTDYVSLNYSGQTGGANIVFNALGGSTSTGGTVNDVEQVNFYGTEGDDTVDATAFASSGGTSYWYGNGGNDNIQGSTSNDYIVGGSGTNTLKGGAGNDDITSNSLTDTIDGGAGDDFLSLDYSGQTTGANITFTGTGTATSGGTITGIEQLYFRGGSGDDVVDATASTFNQNVVGYRPADEMSGGDGNDMLTGGSGRDNLYGEAGNDTLKGNDGNDYLSGGTGTNTLDGGAGNDEITSTSLTDTIDGGIGDDFLTLDYSGQTAGVNITFTGTGTATSGGTITGIEQLYFRGGSGDDVVDATASTFNQNVVGYRPADEMSGGDGNDMLTGGSGRDNLYGEAGNDTLKGSDGNDYLDGGTGTNTLNGEAGNDEIRSTSLTDTIDGGSGDDFLSLDYSGQTAGVNITFTGTGTATSGGTITGIEQLYFRGGSGDDVVDASASNFDRNAIGYRYADEMRGGDGNDTLIGGSGQDNLNGEAGNDTLIGNDGNDYFSGGAGDDVLSGGDGDDSLFGEDGNDTLISGAGNDYLYGYTGDDTYVIDVDADLDVDGTAEAHYKHIYAETGYSGTDTLSFQPSAANITIDISQPNYNYQTVATNGTDNVQVYGDLSGIENVTGGSGNDTITGNNLDNIINGGVGVDTMIGGLGNDTYIVDSTNDVVVEQPGAGTDTVKANANYTLSANVENLTLTGTANITATGNTDANIITGNSGNNTIDGAAGNDTAVFSGDRATYTIERIDAIADTSWSIIDTDPVANGNDGQDTLRNIETLQFVGNPAIVVSDLIGALSDSDIAANKVDENSANGTVVAGITASAIDGNAEAVSYSLTNNAGGRFAIDATTGVVTVANSSLLNFEAIAAHDIIVQATSADGSFTKKTFTIGLTDVNESPTAITLSASSLNENNPANIDILSFSTVDPDGPTSGFAQPFTYALVSGAGDTDNAAFTIDGVNLKITGSSNFEVQPNYNIRLKVTDANGLSYETTQTIAVTDLNERVTDLALSATTIAENTIASVVGDIIVTDPDTNLAFRNNVVTVSDTRFEVVNNAGNLQLKLKAGESLNYEVEPTVNLTLTATNNSLTYSENFTIAVTDANDAAIGLTLSANSVLENTVAGVIGNITIADPDTLAAFQNNTITVDDARFEVVTNAGNLQLKLKAGQSLNYEATPTVTINLTAQTGSLSYTEAFTVNVGNVNEAPTNVVISPSTLNENVAGGVVGNIIITDQDAAAAFRNNTVTVNNARFEVVNNAGNLQLKLKAGQSLNYETTPTVAMILTTTDGSLTYTKPVTVTVGNVNEAVTDLALSASSVSENAVGAVIGNITVTDPDKAAALRNNTITVSDSRFEVVASGTNRQLKLKAGQSLNHEAAATVAVNLTATDGVLSYTEAFTIGVNNVNDAATDLAISALQVDENVAGSVIGNITVTDPDVLAAFRNNVVTVNDTRFEVVDNGGTLQLKLKAGELLDYQTASAVTVNLTATDGSLTYSEAFTIKVNGTIESQGDIKLSVINGYYQAIDTISNVMTPILYGGNPVASDTFAGWSIVGAEKSSTGEIEYMWKNTSGQFWYSTNSDTGAPVADIVSKEVDFDQDFNRDGTIGRIINQSIESFGTTTLTVNATGEYVANAGSGDVNIQYAGSNVGPNTYTAWKVVGAEIDVAAEVKAMWKTDSGQFWYSTNTNNGGIVDATAYESTFQQDFDNDGFITKIGTSGDDDLIGGAGNDRLLGGGGNDTLTGDGGNDKFVYDGVVGAARMTITDFTIGQDKFDLSRLFSTQGITDPIGMGLLQLQSENGNTLVKTDNGLTTIATLTGINPNDLTVANNNLIL